MLLNYQKHSAIALLICFMISGAVSAQVYVEKQSRHRFAQMTMGIDMYRSFGGASKFVDRNGNIETFQLNNGTTPRFIIGGTHFWGHADFYIAFPLGIQKQTIADQEVFFTQGVETGFKYYPWRIEQSKLRPYVGFSLATPYFKQDNLLADVSDGPERFFLGAPLLFGLTFNHKNHLLELGMTWNARNKIDYFISPELEAKIQIPSVYASLSYRFILETTLSAEKEWESGKTSRLVESLGSSGDLDGFFIGIGMSSAWWLKNSSYNEVVRPFFARYATAIMGDFAFGYYFHNADLNIAVVSRRYNGGAKTYGVVQSSRRESIALEATKYLGDYHGFAPFVGPVISHESLSFKESLQGQRTADVETSKIGYGVTFGWDIRPNRIQSFLLRTSLRYFPNLSLDVSDGRSIQFDNLEFNFIQLILYPNRIF